MFAQNVSWIGAARNVGEVNTPCSNCFSHKVERNDVTAFVELGMHLCAILDHRVLVIEGTTLILDRNAHASEGGSEVNDLSNRIAHGKKSTVANINFDGDLSVSPHSKVTKS